MKPIHHAIVSARLFQGNPMDYVAIHTAFDSSKAALGDMRHRAALHSIDHGGAVMQRLYQHHTWPGATTDDLVRQHLEDDQGFFVRLDDWLAKATVPHILTNKSVPSLRPFLDAPAQACAAKWGGTAADYTDVCAYYALPASVSDHPLAPAIAHNTFGIFFSEALFGPALTVQVHGKDRYIPTRDIGEVLTRARYGMLPTLETVLSGLAIADWMTGARVPASRKRRAQRSHRPALFDQV